MKIHVVLCLILLPVLSISVFAGSVIIEPIAFEGWNKCFRIGNGEVELIAVADIGPRILKFGFIEDRNVFNIETASAGKTGGNRWVGYGGHRLWVAPESADVTYYPDNYAVDVRIDGNTLILTAPIEILDATMRESMSYDEILNKANDPEFRKQLRFRKQMEIGMDENGAVTVLHRVVNCGLQTQRVAAWALTVMDRGGLCIIPNPPFEPHGPGHWLPERAILTWSYTNLADPRLNFMQKYVTIRQDPSVKEPLKIGFSNTQRWAAYALNDRLFVKRMNYFANREYPDMGCSLEVFASSGIMEIESLAPLATLKPGDSTTHCERWQLS